MPDQNDQGAYASRSGSFNGSLAQAASSMPDVVVPPPSLANQQERDNMMTPRVFTPQGLNQQIAPSNNGMSADSAQKRKLINGATMPSGLGMSDSTYQKSFALMRPSTSGPGESL